MSREAWRLYGPVEAPEAAVPVPVIRRTPDERMTAARAAVVAWQALQMDDAGQLVSMTCKGCGVPIMALRPVGDPEPSMIAPTPGGVDTRTVLLTQRVRMGPLPEYTLARFDMSDGSRHETAGCAGCVARLTLEQAEAWYCADVDQWAQGLDPAERPARVARWMAREPIGVAVAA